MGLEVGGTCEPGWPGLECSCMAGGGVGMIGGGVGEAEADAGTESTWCDSFEWHFPAAEYI